MKKTLPYLILLLLVSFSACNNSGDDKGTVTDTTIKVADTAITKLNNATDLDTTDIGFFQSAAYGGMIEVESSNKILQSTTNKDIKTFASMIVKDHSSANAQLKALAESKGYQLPITLPPSKLPAIKAIETTMQEGRDEYYVQLMIKEHQNAINIFSLASRSKDAEISKFASTLLPTLNHHYEHVLKQDTLLKAPKANQGDDPLKLSNRKNQH